MTRNSLSHLKSTWKWKKLSLQNLHWYHHNMVYYYWLYKLSLFADSIQRPYLCDSSIMKVYKYFLDPHPKSWIKSTFWNRERMFHCLVTLIKNWQNLSMSWESLIILIVIIMETRNKNGNYSIVNLTTT